MTGPDRDAYEAIALRGRSALAWEVLRRDPAYQRAFLDLPARGVAEGAATQEFVSRWGLHFP